jgi:hypothetical protein
MVYNQTIHYCTVDVKLVLLILGSIAGAKQDHNFEEKNKCQILQSFRVVYFQDYFFPAK